MFPWDVNRSCCPPSHPIYLEHSKDGSSTASVGSFNTFWVKKFFLIPNLNLPSLCFNPPCLITVYLRKKLVSLLFKLPLSIGRPQGGVHADIFRVRLVLMHLFYSENSEQSWLPFDFDNPSQFHLHWIPCNVPQSDCSIMNFIVAFYEIFFWKPLINYWFPITNESFTTHPLLLNVE